MTTYHLTTLMMDPEYIVSDDETDYSSSDEERSSSFRHVHQYSEAELQRAREANVSLEVPRVYLGKDDFEWNSTEPNQAVRASRENILGGLPGLKTGSSSWYQLFT